MSLQQEISMQNATLINHLETVTRDLMGQNHAEIATLRRALQRTQEDLETTQYHMNEVVEHAVSAYVINDSIFCMLAAVQQETNSHVSSNELEDEASSVARTTEETTERDLICKVCNSGGACMLLLPCHHLCACKPCGGHLMACPICGAVKDEAIELARSG